MVADLLLEHSRLSVVDDNALGHAHEQKAHAVLIVLADLHRERGGAVAEDREADVLGRVVLRDADEGSLSRDGLVRNADDDDAAGAVGEADGVLRHLCEKPRALPAHVAAGAAGLVERGMRGLLEVEHFTLGDISCPAGADSGEDVERHREVRRAGHMMKLMITRRTALHHSTHHTAATRRHDRVRVPSRGLYGMSH